MRLLTSGAYRLAIVDMASSDSTSVRRSLRPFTSTLATSEPEPEARPMLFGSRHPACNPGVARLRHTPGSLVLITTAFTAAACSTDAPTRPTADVQTVVSEPQLARQPASPPSGTLSLCKQGGAGIPAGQSFTFQVTLADVLRT